MVPADCSSSEWAVYERFPIGVGTIGCVATSLVLRVNAVTALTSTLAAGVFFSSSYALAMG